MRKPTLRQTSFFRLLLTGLLAAVSFFSLAQNAPGNELKVFKYLLNDQQNAIDLYVKAIEGGKPVKIKPADFFVFEKYEQEDSVRLSVLEVVQQDSFAEASADEGQNFFVLFLAGLNGDSAANAGLQLSAIASQINLGIETQYYAAGYGDSFYQPQSVALEEAGAAIGRLAQNATYSELHKALAESVRFLRGFNGRRVIILLTDGKNLPNLSQYDANSEIPYDTTDIRYFLSSLDDNFMIFPIGTGGQPDAAMLKFITDATPNKSDTFSIGNAPDQLGKLLFTQKKVLFNNIVRLKPNPGHLVYKGEKRTLSIIWNGRPDGCDMSGIGSIGSPNSKLLPKDYADWGSWLMLFFIGIALVLGALGVMNWLVPWLRQRDFRKRFIVPYKEKGGVRKRDPLSDEPFKEGERVVIKCPRLTSSLDTWEFVGNKCPQYPRCLNFDPPCEGHGAPIAEDSFFSMKGIFRKLNWLWFGMLGGFIAWCLLAVVNTAAYDSYYSMVSGFFEQAANAAGRTAGQLDEFITNLTNDLVVGTAFGLGISFALSWVEERSQPRRFSWVRVGLRTLVGVMVSMLVFLVGFYLQYAEIVKSPLLAGFISWLLFGVAIGGVMSVESSITLWRGILGGVAASALAFGVYWLMSNFLFTNDFPLAKLVSLLALGGVLGLTLVSVVSTLEDFELEYLAPEAFRQTNPVSKWLKKNIDVFIGSEQGSYVYVKWKDEAVIPRHARMRFQKGVVFIEAFAETLVNGRMLPLKKSIPLQDGDVIQLGRDSVTTMRFREKRKSQAPPPPREMKGSPAPVPAPRAGGGSGIVIKSKD